MTPTCVRCEKPTADGYACVTCTGRAVAQLAEIADMTPAARDVAQRQTRRGGGGGASGKPGSSLPLDLGATARLDAVRNGLTTWVRHIAETRGVEMPRPPAVRPMIGPGCPRPYSCHHGSCKALREPLRPSDDLALAACWLADHVEWMRHRPEIDEFLTDVEACVRVVRGLARGPAEHKYLGPCGVLVLESYERSEPAPGVMDEAATMRHCEGDVYGRVGAPIGRCRTCGAEVDQDERRAWLDEEVRSRAFRASRIAGAYSISVKTIRSWAARSKLRTWWADGDQHAEWIEPERPDLPIDPTEEQVLEHKAQIAEIEAELKARGPRLFIVGDVLDLAAADAVRREQARAEREQHTTVPEHGS